MTQKSYQDTLEALCAQDDRIVVMTAENRAAIRGLPPKIGPRFIDVGICEQTMIGMAAGLALRGRVPFVHALSVFLTMRAFEFIRTDLGIAGLKALIVGGVPGFLSDGNGPTHQAIEDIALMRGIPGMHVFCPADNEELVQAIPLLTKTDQACYIRYYDGAAPVVHKAPVEVGKAEVLTEGDDIAILSVGFLLKETAKAQKILSDAGHSTRLCNMRFVSPLDVDAVRDAAKTCKLVVCVEDHFKRGGLYSAVIEQLADEGIHGNVRSIALDQKWFAPGRLPQVLDNEGFTGEKLAKRIEALFKETV